MKTLVLLLTAFSLVVSPATASNGADDVAWNRYLVLADNSTCLQETQQINTPAFNNLIVAGGEVPAVINGTNTYVVNILKDECIGKQLQNCEADVALARELKGDKLYYVPDLVKELCASAKGKFGVKNHYYNCVSGDKNLSLAVKSYPSCASNNCTDAEVAEYQDGQATDTLVARLATEGFTCDTVPTSNGTPAGVSMSYGMLLGIATIVSCAFW